MKFSHYQINVSIDIDLVPVLLMEPFLGRLFHGRLACLCVDVP